MIKIRNITKRYGPHAALDGVDLDVAPGEVYGILGRSGAGKSTLLRTVNVLERPDSGTVTVFGQELTGLGERELSRARRRIGMIFQQYHLLQRRTVAANVALPLELDGRTKGDQRRRVAELLDRVGLADKAGAYPAQLSGGQRQRVAIARALAAEPHVLLSDEATSALDPETTTSILGLLRDLNHELNLTILLITHEHHVIRQVADRVSVIEAGRIVSTETTAGFALRTEPTAGPETAQAEPTRPEPTGVLS
ncbi:ATP-binding cassette domain-containing protein [Longispora sp. K20-0274]|uniref:methionine ABC transporter ATP-binding protein n=1 Tax=Longispora sp. K20-0274 TaxID=3088255 RepID=UPI00399B7955